MDTDMCRISHLLSGIGRCNSNTDQSANQNEFQLFISWIECSSCNYGINNLISNNIDEAKKDKIIGKLSKSDYWERRNLFTFRL